jgi:CheY-like chemotaxis protein
MAEKIDLEKEFQFLGLLDKAREIYSELGDRAALSYVRSSFRLLSKVYHPDMNPRKAEKANAVQQRINRIHNAISEMSEEDLIALMKTSLKQSVMRKKKILVVEDEFGLQDVLRSVFLMEGYDTRIAVDGDNGYAIYKQFKPDLVFTDVVMPNLNGIELVKKIRKEQSDIKVIFVSGFFGIKKLKQDLDDEILKNNYRTLSKPFKISDMLDMVHEYLQDAP